MATKHTRASRQLRGDAAPSVERAAGRQYDGSVVGHRVKVNWRGQGTWFTGVVKDYAPATQKHLVKYDHDDQFPEHNWHLLGNEEQQAENKFDEDYQVHAAWLMDELGPPTMTREERNDVVKMYKKAGESLNFKYG